MGLSLKEGPASRPHLEGFRHLNQPVACDCLTALSRPRNPQGTQPATNAGYLKPTASSLAKTSCLPSSPHPERRPFLASGMLLRARRVLPAALWMLLGRAQCPTTARVAEYTERRKGRVAETVSSRQGPSTTVCTSNRPSSTVQNLPVINRS